MKLSILRAYPRRLGKSTGRFLVLNAQLIAVLFLFAYVGNALAIDDNSETLPLNITFQSEKSRLWLNEPQVIAFEVKQPSPYRQHCSFQVDSTAIRVLDSPLILEGQKIGYMRVIGLRPGSTKINVENSSMEVEIVPDDDAALIKQDHTEIVAPTQGAMVWGSFVVGVERFGNEHRTAPILNVNNGHQIYGHSVPNEGVGPVARFVYTVHPEDLSPGTNTLSITDQADQPPSTLVIRYAATKPEITMQDRFENELNTPRPKEAGPIQPKVVDAKERGKVVAVDPGVCLPLTTTDAGVYQMFVSVRGDLGGNALPTVAMMLDQRQDLSVAQTRLATTEWQRMPLGAPFKIAPGVHTLTVRLRNPFYGTQDDRRTLLLESFELARLDRSAPPAAIANGPIPTATNPANSIVSAPAASSMMEGQASMMQGQGSSMMEETSAAGKGGKSAFSTQVADDNNFGVVIRNGLDGAVITQKLHVSGLCFWPDHEHLSPPRVELLVNHQAIAQMTSPRPMFTIAPDQFQPGKNVLELKATLSNGQFTISPAETVTVPSELAAEPGQPKRAETLRYTVWDAGWNGKLQKMITDPQNEPGVAAFFSNGDAVLSLPNDLKGSYKIFVEARGTDFKGPPLITLIQNADGQENQLAKKPILPPMAETFLTQATFDPGPKKLIVRYDNDAFEAGKGDRNFFLKAIRLEPVTDGASVRHVHPFAMILYPKSAVTVGPADAVVAEVKSSGFVTNIDLLIDGQVQHFDLSQAGIPGPAVLPLITRGLTPGGHQVAVVATTDSGETCQSSPVTINVANPGSSYDPTYDHAVFLLNRMAYGPEPAQLASILVNGPKAWLRKALFAHGTDPNELSELTRLHLQFPQPFDTVGRATLYLLTEPNPVRARFVMWAENHFSTWIEKEGADQKGPEHDAFAKIGPAPFFDLLFTSSTSPAMITYLDQRNSFANRLNENYAREIMELHTLGVKGGYNQKDVTTLADLLTGWTLSDEAPPDGGGRIERIFRYDPDVNSDKPCQILGMEFPGWEPEHRFDRVQMALEMLVAHPSCAQFISTKLLEHYLSDPPPPELVDVAAKVYRETGGDVREMLLAMVDQPAFWKTPHRVASPFDYSIRASRIAQSEDAGLVSTFLSSSGMGMFDRATPDGYPEADGFYCSSNGLLQRWKFSKNIQNAWLFSGVLPRSILGQQQPPGAPAPAGEIPWTTSFTQHVIDTLSYRATGSLLAQASNEAALNLITSSPALGQNARCHLLASFIQQLPEASLR